MQERSTTRSLSVKDDNLKIEVCSFGKFDQEVEAESLVNNFSVLRSFNRKTGNGLLKVTQYWFREKPRFGRDHPDPDQLPNIKSKLIFLAFSLSALKLRIKLFSWEQKIENNVQKELDLTKDTFDNFYEKCQKESIAQSN